MKRYIIIIIAAFCTLSTHATSETNFKFSQVHNMGPGRWDCEKVIEIAKNGASAELAHVVGWVLGSWSMASAVREEEFVDIVEEVGATEIFRKTIGECQKVPPQIKLFRVVYSMIEKTNPK